MGDSVFKSTKDMEASPLFSGLSPRAGSGVQNKLIVELSFFFFFGSGD